MAVETSVRVENLRKIFYNKKTDRSINAVDGISFELESGEIFGFLGPNGAGKTTTIRMLAGLLKPTSGYASIFNKSVQDMGDRIRLNIGYLTENHGNYENLTVYENLRFFGSFYNLDDIQTRINDVLQIFEMEDRRDMKVGKLSKGLKQRAALSRVLLHNPHLIFLDEPTAGLDPAAASKVRDLIKKLKSKDRIFFINSHNLEEVQKTCDRVAILNNGKIMRMGTAEELSKEIFGSQELCVKTVEPVSDNMIDDILRNDYVENARRDASGLYIHLQDLERYTPEIVTMMVNGGQRILEVTPTSHSLEEIYLTLMDESDKDQLKTEVQ